MQWDQIFFFIGAGLAGWLLYRSIKNQPQLYSAASLSKSALTMGLLALGLIAFITFCVIVLRQSTVVA